MLSSQCGHLRCTETDRLLEGREHMQWCWDCRICTHLHFSIRFSLLNGLLPALLAHVYCLTCVFTACQLQAPSVLAFTRHGAARARAAVVLPPNWSAHHTNTCISCCVAHHLLRVSSLSVTSFPILFFVFSSHTPPTTPSFAPFFFLST